MKFKKTLDTLINFTIKKPRDLLLITLATIGITNSTNCTINGIPIYDNKPTVYSMRFDDGKLTPKDIAPYTPKTPEPKKQEKKDYTIWYIIGSALGGAGLTWVGNEICKHYKDDNDGRVGIPPSTPGGENEGGDGGQ